MSAGIRAGSSNDGYVQVNGNDIITALSGGNVGIGVSSPSTKLHVNGTITATNFAGSGGITTDDWIVHAGDTNTKFGFSAADTISFHTAGTEVVKIGSTGNLELPNNNDYIKIGSGGPLSLVHTGSAAFINNSTGFLTHRCDTHQWEKGDGSAEYFRSNATGFAIGHVAPVRKFSVKSSGENAVSISLLDNNSTNEIWRVGQASDGDGYVEVLEDGGTVGCKLDASGNSFTMGNFGIGDASPSQLLTISHAANTTNGILIKNTNNSQASAIAQLELSGGDNSHGRVQFECNGKYATIRHDGNGHLTFWTNGSNERMRIKDNGNVGIGNRTSNPNSLLHVHTGSGDAVQRIEGAADAWLILTSHGGDSQIRFGDAGSDSAGQIRFDHGTDNLFFEKGGSQRGKIASDGSTTWGPSSAGTSNMQWTKDTNQIPHFFWGQSGGAQPSDGCVVIGSPQTDICSQRIGTILFGSTTSGGSGNTGLKAGINCVTNASPGSDFNAGGNLIFQTKPNNATIVERLRIKADSAILHTRSDNVGRHDVEFRNTGGIGTGNWGGIKWTQGATGNTFLGGILIAYHDTGRPDMVFYRRDGGGTGSAETLRLDRDGALKMVGRSFTMGTQSDSGASVGITGNAWSNNEIGIKMSHKVTGGQSFFVFYNNNGQVGYIQSSGSGTIYNTGSDYRLKENQVLISDGITRLKQLKPYRFNFKKDPSTTLDGFFAHEVQPVVPEAIAGTKDEVATKDEGDRKKGDPILQGMDYGRITPLLTAALQEAIAKIEVLETKVAALESS